MSISISECRLYKIPPAKTNSPQSLSYKTDYSFQNNNSLPKGNRISHNDQYMENVMFNPKCKSVDCVPSPESRYQSLQRKNSYKLPTERKSSYENDEALNNKISSSIRHSEQIENVSLPVEESPRRDIALFDNTSSKSEQSSPNFPKKVSMSLDGTYNGTYISNKDAHRDIRFTSSLKVRGEKQYSDTLVSQLRSNELIAERRRSKSTVTSEHIDISIDSLLENVNNAMKSINM